jgi:hypothetical protein
MLLQMCRLGWNSFTFLSYIFPQSSDAVADVPFRLACDLLQLTCSVLILRDVRGSLRR